MNFGHLSYLISIIIFAGLAFLLEYKMWNVYFKRYKRILFIFILFSVPVAMIAEFIALKWKTWQYVYSSFSGIIIGSAPETILFLMIVSVVIAIPTLYDADCVDKKISISKSIISSLKNLIKF